MALRNHWSRHDRCCWGRTGFQQLGGGAGRAGTCAVHRPFLARPVSSLKIACSKLIERTGAFYRLCFRAYGNEKPGEAPAAKAGRTVRLSNTGGRFRKAKRQSGPEPWTATTLDSFSRFDSTGFW